METFEVQLKEVIKEITEFIGSIQFEYGTVEEQEDELNSYEKDLYDLEDLDLDFDEKEQQEAGYFK